jgi:hypothetical protein
MRSPSFFELAIADVVPHKRGASRLRSQRISNSLRMGVGWLADGRQLADFSLVDQPTFGLRLSGSRLLKPK